MALQGFKWVMLY